MSIAMSFPQLLAISKGVNYLYNKLGNPIKISSLLGSSGFAFTPFPPNLPTSTSNYVIGIYSNASTYALSNSTALLSSQLVYKTGGNIGRLNRLTFYPVIKDQRDTSNPERPRLFAGDMIMMLNANTVDQAKPSEYKIVNKTLVLNGLTYAHSRGVLVGTFVDVSQSLNQYTYTPPLLGELLLETLLTTRNVDSTWPGITIYFKGYVGPLGNPANNINDFKYHVGLGRDHRTSDRPDQNPNGNYPGVRLSGALYGFMPFYNPDGSYTWWAVVHTTNNNLSPLNNTFWHSYNTGLNAFTSQRLRVNIQSDGNINWYVNTQTAPVTSFDSNTIINPGGNFDELCTPYCGFRENKSNISNLNNFPVHKQEFIIEEFLVYPAVYKEYPFTFPDTSTTLDINESFYHKTGVQLLKKLK